MGLNPFAALMVFSSVPLAAQDEPLNVRLVLYRHEKVIRAVPGVIELAVGAVNGNWRLVVRVKDPETRDAVRAVCGETLEGYPVYILVSSPSPEPRAAAPAAAPPSPPTASKVGQTVALPRHPPGETQAGLRKKPEDEAWGKLNDDTLCDIIREFLKLPTRADLKTPGAPRCALSRRIVIGPTGSDDTTGLLRMIPTPAGATPWKRGAGAAGTAWWCDYPRHRSDCPILRRQAVEWIRSGRAPTAAVPTVDSGRPIPEPRRGPNRVDPWLRDWRPPWLPGFR